MSGIRDEWQTDDGSVRLLLGDCLEILPVLGKVDCVVTDPPYGIGEHGGACRTRGAPGYAKHENFGWDNERPTRQLIDQIFRSTPNIVIWGGNYFADLLPPSMGWLYWRKLMGGDFSDGELAWTSRKAALREFTKCPKGIDKQHPCQKPVELMEWCIEYIKARPGDTVLDPFCGSGTTGVACIRLGRKFVGIEREPKYFEIAKRRIRDELEKTRLIEKPKRLIQKGFLEPAACGPS